MIKKAISLFTIFCAMTLALSAQNWEWTKTAGGPSQDKITAIIHDQTGNVFITGFFDSLISFDSMNLVSAGGTDVFLAKYDADGILQWAKQVGGQNDDYATGIATDITGNCYLSGFFFIQGTTSTFGTTSITQAADADIFVSKFSAAGELLWVRNGGGKNEDAAFACATDVSGNCYVTGYFSGQAQFGNYKINSQGYSDIFIAKYDAAGNIVWVRTGGGAYQDEAHAISTDVAGNCYITGFFTGNATFFRTNLSSTGYFDSDVLMLKYNPSGVLVWAKKVGGVGNDVGKSITVQKNGTLFVCGTFQGTKAFGEGVLDKSSLNNGFAARFESNGKMSWVRATYNESVSEYNSISSDGEGNSYVAGSFRNDVTIDAQELTSAGGKDICLVKYDPMGKLMWVLQAGGPDDDMATAISSDAAGGVFAGGQFTDGARIGTLRAQGWALLDLFFSRIK